VLITILHFHLISRVMFYLLHRHHSHHS